MNNEEFISQLASYFVNELLEAERSIGHGCIFNFEAELSDGRIFKMSTEEKDVE